MEAPQGSLSITVASITGISKGSTLTIGSGGNAELALVDSVTGSVVNLSSPLTQSHGSGEKVSQGTQVEYRDAELPQDACANGRVMAFGKQSAPVVAGGSTAFASGLSPKGRLVASASHRTSFFGAPLVAWKPALGADAYQVEWSKKAYPWKAAGIVGDAVDLGAPASQGRPLVLPCSRSQRATAWLGQGDVVVVGAATHTGTARLPRRSLN